MKRHEEMIPAICLWTIQSSESYLENDRTRETLSEEVARHEPSRFIFLVKRIFQSLLGCTVLIVILLLNQRLTSP